MKRILVCGSRLWSDPKPIAWMLAGISQRMGEITVVHGGAKGADHLAGVVAEKLEFDVDVYPAEWDTHGKAAGPIRNQKMLDSGVDIVLAFKADFDHSLKTGGTEHMVRIARAANVPTYIIEV